MYFQSRSFLFICSIFAIAFVNGTEIGGINGVGTRGKFDITSNLAAGGNSGLAVINQNWIPVFTGMTDGGS